jgi:hypothetical protein
VTMTSKVTFLGLTICILSICHFNELF